jgi:hypothetical protein
MVPAGNLADQSNAVSRRVLTKRRIIKASFPASSQCLKMTNMLPTVKWLVFSCLLSGKPFFLLHFTFFIQFRVLRQSYLIIFRPLPASCREDCPSVIFFPSDHVSLAVLRVFDVIEKKNPAASNGHCVILIATEYFTKWQKRLLARLSGTTLC